MTHIPDSSPNVSPLLQAALLLAARGLLRHHSLEHPTAAAILEATGAGRTRAYELADELMVLLSSLERPVGRPRKASDDTDEGTALGATLPQDAVLEYLMANPGCVSGNKRNRYADAFRHFILDLRERHASMPLAHFAQAVHVPIKTLQQWVRDASRALDSQATLGCQTGSSSKAEIQRESCGSDENAQPQDSLVEAGPETVDEPVEIVTSGPIFCLPNKGTASLTDKSCKDQAHANDVKEPSIGADTGCHAGASEPATDSRIQTVLSEYKSWKGSFSDFCKHLKNNCHLDYGRSTIGNILSSHGLRTPKKRPRRSPDERALRDAFEVFFPGAQWVGDGHEITLTINEKEFKLNLELYVDAYASAFVGAHVSPHEDSNAIISAFQDGIETTGDQPLSVLLDNRSSNHTEEVQSALERSLLIRSTLGRAQNKAHVEGAFGLFQQTAPPLQITASTPPELAAAIVALIVTVWARTLNGKKRATHGNRSRIELYQQSEPSREQIEQARAALKERQRKQEKAYQTRIARQNPVVRRLLQEAFNELELCDPDGNVQPAIARYPLDAIVEGIALYKAKKIAGSLPESAGARYLLGIVKNVHVENELRHLVDELLQARLQARDKLLEHLVTERAVLQKAETNFSARMDLFIARALDTDSLLTRLFWLRSTAEQIQTTPESQHHILVRRAAARIATTYHASPTTRQQATQYLIALIVPLH